MIHILSSLLFVETPQNSLKMILIKFNWRCCVSRGPHFSLGHVFDPDLLAEGETGGWAHYSFTVHESWQSFDLFCEADNGLMLLKQVDTKTKFVHLQLLRREPKLVTLFVLTRPYSARVRSRQRIRSTWKTKNTLLCFARELIFSSPNQRYDACMRL